MGFWIFKLFFALLIPIGMIGLGKYLIKNASKEIKRDFVYRSSMSTKNKDTLEFAYHNCGKLLIPIGLIMLVVTIITMMVVIGEDKINIKIFSGILVIIQIIFLGSSVFYTERALRRNFDEYGNRK